MTRTSARPSRSSARVQRVGAPAIAQDSVSHTRTVSAGGARFAFLHHVEVVVEGRDFVDLGRRELELLRERDEVRGRQAAVRVLDAVQVLDQQVRAPRRVAEQRADLGERRRDRRARPFGVARTLRPL